MLWKNLQQLIKEPEETNKPINMMRALFNFKEDNNMLNLDAMKQKKDEIMQKMNTALKKEMKGFFTSIY